MSQMDNANPVVLSATDLPTRRGRNVAASKSSDSGLIAALDAFPSYAADPFSLAESSSSDSEIDEEDAANDPVDAQEIYDLISTISDPEHPLSLGSLAVVNLPDCEVVPIHGQLSRVTVLITPTITHCSLATVIGLGVRVRLEQALPPHFRVDVRIKEGTHSQDEQVNKQLADKERVAAALENATLMGVLRKMLETCA